MLHRQGLLPRRGNGRGGRRSFDSLGLPQPHVQRRILCTLGNRRGRQSPDLELQLEFITELLPDALPNLVDEFEHIRGFRTRVGDDEVGVSVGDFRPAVPRSFQTGLVDQRPCGKVGTDVLENAAGRLMAVRLVFLFDDPESCRMRLTTASGSSEFSSNSAESTSGSSSVWPPRPESVRSSRSRTWT